MAKQEFKPASRVMAGDVLVASIIRHGNGRPGSPVRWLVYWSPLAERMGAQPGVTFRYRQEAEAAAMRWAVPRMAHAPRVELAQ
ncbi:hypothetical protein [Thauera propionica]|uniref:hypothetical protein n=1 Tax=Thauera propionica TaxID=2019431 RepID=UPI0023F4C7E9|nr:hypothetical protein [Thauera propionica]MDD3676043.1 hypothetical protein [Thauera propionica]